MSARLSIDEGDLSPPVEVPVIDPADPPAPPTALSRGDLLTYGLAAFGPGLLQSPMTLYVPQLYAKEFGISLAALGTALVALRIVNAFTDQLIGWMSDHTRTRWGARKPWIAVGAALMLVAAFFLLRPPPVVGLAYLVGWKVLYDFAYTLTDISYTAWGAELASDYDSRSRITGMRGLINQVGNLANDALPIVLAWGGLVATSAYSIPVLGYFFIVALVVIPATTALCLARAPQGRPLPPQRMPFWRFVASTRHNRPLWLYLAAFSLGGMSLGVLQLMFMFYDGYMRLGPYYPWLMTLFAIVMTGTTPMWSWAATRMGKHRAYVVSVVIVSLATQGYWFLDPVAMPKSLIIGVSAVIVSFIGMGASAILVLSPAILADVVDYGRLKTHEQRTGGYYAFYMLTTKIATALGAGMGFLLLHAFGYDAKAGAVNTGWAAFGILFTVAALPAVLKVGGGLIIWNFPLDRRRHAIIERRLAQRAARAARATTAKSGDIT
ncbi:MFS transporter [Novosphingobium sp. FSY-8]|uniref:MFS transporter n=1 Tax=Novosphingobium ovatum TaxID=1908523 RepID=A0ABW9X9Y9_9SPHN|nr:MFS transporter [Novosphingobium ovatum]NBC35350.1 MFS transporter [Novosphingobium ovatum]